MRFSERLIKLKAWTYINLCRGREMKAPAPNQDIGTIARQEPKVYLGWAPSRMDKSGQLREDPVSVVPGIIIMPNPANAKLVEEKRFDQYHNVHRPQKFGQNLSVSMLFSVYEPGVRLPGFVDSIKDRGQGLDPELIMEGTEQGLLTLFNWMDDCMELLLGTKIIPHTDLFVRDETVTYSLYTDQQYVVDHRPVYYGFVNVIFGCYAEEGQHLEIDELLK